MYCIPPWVPTLDLCLSQAPRPNTFTFCTISKNGMPRARTCVFRSWLFNDKSTGVLLFTTDLRSQKIDDLKFNDGKFEACFYFRKASSESDAEMQDSLSSSASSFSGVPSTPQSSSIQIRLSGFAQPLMPARNFYPSLYVPSEQPSPYNMASFQTPNSPSASSMATALYNSPPQESVHVGDSKNTMSHEQQQQQQPQSPSAAATNTTQLAALKGNAIYPIYSPSYLERYRIQYAHDFQSNTYHKNYINMTSPQAAANQDSNMDEDSTPPPPTHAEWDEEYARIWATMSRYGKASFRRPCPGSELDDESRRKLDKLSRGVDGASTDAGKDQFVVMAMFVNSSDIFYDSLNRRSKSYRIEDDEWIEIEVCP